MLAKSARTFRPVEKQHLCSAYMDYSQNLNITSRLLKRKDLNYYDLSLGFSRVFYSSHLIAMLLLTLILSLGIRPIHVGSSDVSAHELRGDHNPTVSKTTKSPLSEYNVSFSPMSIINLSSNVSFDALQSKCIFGLVTIEVSANNYNIDYELSDTQEIVMELLRGLFFN